MSLKGLYPKQACIKHLLQVRQRAYTSNTTREKQQEHKVANIQVIHLSKQTRVRDNTKRRWVVVWFLQHGSWLKNFCIKNFCTLKSLRRYQYLTACLNSTLRRQVKKSYFQVTQNQTGPTNKNIKNKLHITENMNCVENRR